MDFNKLEIHDSSVDKLEYDIEREELVVTGKKWCDSIKSTKTYCLVFKHVGSISIPNAQPWGKSNSVNSQTFRDGEYSIELQSGDIIKVCASSCEAVGI